MGLVAVALVVRWGFRDDAISPVAPEALPPMVVEGTSQTVRKDGKRLWQFDAARIELSPDGSQTLAHGVTNGILFRDDKPILHLTAPLVRLENASNNVEASGGVHAAGDGQFEVTAPLVRWNYKGKLLSCPLPVQAKLREFTFSAPRLDYRWDTGALTCEAPVELRAPGVRLEGTHLHASTKTRALELGGSELSFDVSKARPDKWRELLALTLPKAPR